MAAFTFTALVNNASTTLTQAMTTVSPANGGKLGVTDGTVFPTKGYALVDSELIHFDSVLANVLTLNAVDGRGAGGTTIAAHNISTTIYADIRVAAHINELVAGSPNQILSAKGDLLVASAANTPSRLAVGTDGQIVHADSAQTVGLAYTAGLKASGQVPISDQTITVATYFIDFLSIPQSYKHLMLILSTRCDKAAVNADVTYLDFNGDAGTNYDALAVQISNAGISTTEALAFTAARITDQPALAATANAFSASIIYIPDYTNASNLKSVFGFAGLNRDVVTGFLNWDSASAMWKSSAAITRITVLTAGGVNFVAGSRATLYGLV